MRRSDAFTARLKVRRLALTALDRSAMLPHPSAGFD